MSNDDISSPPLTPLKNRTSPFDPNAPSQPQSPTSQHQHPRQRRRSSGLSSLNNDRSPVSARGHRHRFSNASQDSFLALRDEGVTDGPQGEGMGNLADELDFMSDEGEFEEHEDVTEVEGETAHAQERETGSTAADSGSAIDGARDSGIDVSYEDRRKFGKGGTVSRGRTGEGDEGDEADDRLSPDLEDLITTVARMAASTNSSSSSSNSTSATSSSSTSSTNSTSNSIDDDPLIPRTLALLQDLGNQSSLEASTQRLTTSTNSITANLTAQTKTLQTLSTTLYSPFGTPAWQLNLLDPSLIDDCLPLLDTLLQTLPGHPFPPSSPTNNNNSEAPTAATTTPLHALQKLDRESSSLLAALSQLTDSLQMGRQATNEASRLLRKTLAMVVELRVERERAEAAREELAVEGGWHQRFQERWCRDECRDILKGFEGVCEGLREGIVRRGEGGEVVGG